MTTVFVVQPSASAATRLRRGRRLLGSDVQSQKPIRRPEEGRGSGFPASTNANWSWEGKRSAPSWSPTPSQHEGGEARGKRQVRELPQPAPAKVAEGDPEQNGEQPRFS